MMKLTGGLARIGTSLLAVIVVVTVLGALRPETVGTRPVGD